jgi:nitrogen regulatory protein PII
MKMVFITYNVAMHDEVMELLRHHGLETYTRWEHVTGVGKSGGPRLDTYVWPGRNSAIAVAATDENASALLEAVREMRQSMSGVGIKAFLMPVEEVT